MEESEVDDATGATAQDGQEQTSSVDESVLVAEGSPVNAQNTTSMASQEALQEHEGSEGLVKNSGKTASSEGKTKDLKKITCPFCSTELYLWRHKSCFECGTSIKEIKEQLEGNSSPSSDIQVRSRSRVGAQPGKVVVVSGFVEHTKKEVGVAEASSKGTDVQRGLPTGAPLGNVAIGSKRSSDRSSVKVDTENVNKKQKHGGEGIEKNIAEVSEDSAETKEPDHDGQNVFDVGQNLPETTESPENLHQFYQQNEDEMDQSHEETQRQVYEERKSEVEKNTTESTRSRKTDAETSETYTCESSELGEQTQAGMNENIEKQSGKNESEAVGSNTETSVYGHVELEANKDIKQAGQLEHEERKEFHDPIHIKKESRRSSSEIEISEQVKQEANEDIQGAGQLGGEEQKEFNEPAEDPTYVKVEKEESSSGTEVTEQVKQETSEDIQGARQVKGEQQKEFNEPAEEPTYVKVEKEESSSGTEVTEQVKQETSEDIQGARQVKGEEQKEFNEPAEEPTHINAENERSGLEFKITEQNKLEANEDIGQAGQLGQETQGVLNDRAKDPTHVKVENKENSLGTQKLGEEKEPEANENSKATEELGGQTHEHAKGTDTSELFEECIVEANREITQTQKAGNQNEKTKDNGKTEEETRDICKEDKQLSEVVKDHDIKAKSGPEGGDEKSKQSAEKSKEKPPETENVYKECAFGSLDESQSRSSGSKDLPRTEVDVTENPLSNESRQSDEQGNSHDGGSSSGDGKTPTLKKLAEQHESSQTSGNKQGNSHDGGSSSGDGKTPTVKKVAEQHDSSQTSRNKQSDGGYDHKKSNVEGSYTPGRSTNIPGTGTGNENRSQSQTGGPVTRTTGGKGIRIVFHAILSEKFEKNSNMRIFIQGETPIFRDWNENAVEMLQAKTLDKNNLLLRGEITVPVRYADRRVAYKYVVLSKEKIQYEDLIEFSSWGGITDRCLVIPKEFVKENATWDKYDGFIYPPRASGYFSSEYLSVGWQNDDRREFFKLCFPKWSGFHVNATQCDLSPIAAVPLLVNLVESVKFVWTTKDGFYKCSSLSDQDLRLSEVIRDFLAPKILDNLAVMSNGTTGAKSIVTAVLSSVVIAHVFSLYVVLSNDLLEKIFKCLKLPPDKEVCDAVMEEMLKFGDNELSTVAESLCKLYNVYNLTRLPKSLTLHWLHALPLLHFLRRHSKPFVDPTCGKIDQTWKWWGLKDFRVWDIRRCITISDAKELLPELSRLFDMDRLLRRSFLMLSPVEVFRDFLATGHFSLLELCATLRMLPDKNTSSYNKDFASYFSKFFHEVNKKLLSTSVESLTPEILAENEVLLPTLVVLLDNMRQHLALNQIHVLCRLVESLITLIQLQSDGIEHQISSEEKEDQDTPNDGNPTIPAKEIPGTLLNFLKQGFGFVTQFLESQYLTEPELKNRLQHDTHQFHTCVSSHFKVEPCLGESGYKHSSRFLSESQGNPLKWCEHNKGKQHARLI